MMAAQVLEAQDEVMETWDAMRARRSVRQFTEQPVPDEALDRILEAGRRAPSASNWQPCDFVLVTNGEPPRRALPVGSRILRGLQTMEETRPAAGAADDDAASVAAVERLREQGRTLRVRISRLSDDMAALIAASRDSNADDEHDPEGQTIAYERSQLSALTGQALEHLAEVDAAIERVATGTYGVCEVCGEPIDEARLEARPTARTCVHHVPAR